MSSTIKYHKVTPETVKDAGHTEFDTVDFVMTGQGRKLVKNSVLLAYKLQVNSAANTPKTTNDQIRYNHKIGGHSFIDQIVVSNPNGNIEVLESYPIFVNQVRTATLGQNDYYSADLIAEGCGPIPENAEIGSERVASNNEQATGAAAIDFTDSTQCIRPLMCLNRMSGGDYSFDNNGPLRVSLSLARLVAALQGQDNSNAAEYKLVDLRLYFKSVPDDGAKDKMMMLSYGHLKQSINSNSANISSRIPAKAVTGVTVSFLLESDESNFKNDSYALNKFPNLEEVRFLFSDNLSNNISYSMEEPNDMLKRGLKALGSAGHDQAQYSKMIANKGFLLGQDFAQAVDISQNKFTIQIKSSHTQGSPYVAHAFFHNILSMSN
tara:strand:+ start:4874 stop:6010 length:1137 start_codon:yes stop_codon:yes gene_type:complete